MPGYEAGDQVRIKSALYRRRGHARIYMRGQVITVTEQDLERGDLDQIFAPVTEGELETVRELTTEEEPDIPEEFSEPTFDNLKDMLSRASVAKAKKLLSDERWMVEGMRLALQAEQEGKNRATVVDYIENRILDLDAEEEEGTPT